MKLVIDINKDVYDECHGHIYYPDTGAELFDAVKSGTPFESIVEEITAEVFRQSKETNERFSHDWNEGFNDGMFHAVIVLKEVLKHISGKE